MRDQQPEQSQPECEELARAILENSPDCLGLLDAAGRFLMINETGRRLLESQDAAESCGKEWRLMWPSVARPRIDLAMAAARSGNKGRFREWCPTSKGEAKFWDVIVTPLLDDAGQIIRFLTVSRDITDIKRMDDELRRGARRNALVSEAASRLLQSEDPQAIIEGLCREAMGDLECQLFFNFLFDEAKGRFRLNAFNGITKEEALRFERLDHDGALRSCAALGCEGDCACAARDLRELLEFHGVTAYCCYPLVAQGRVIGALSFGSRTRSEFSGAELELIRTLSHFVSMAIARAQMERALRESDRRKDEFIATLAHELRNPLAAIRSSFHVLSETGGAAAPRLQPIIERQLDQLVRLVDDLLDTARIATGEIVLKKTRVDLASVIQQSIEVNEALLRSRAHRITVRLPSQALFVEGDPARLAQIFANLIDNAAKYTAPNGRIDVSGALEGHEAVVSVRDNGAGIPGDKLESIFEMFNRLGDPVDEFHGGLGVGLNLARRLVEKHGGKLEARSGGAGCGSEFLLRLPLAAQPQDEPPDAIESAGSAISEPCRVLVVDDDRDVADSLLMLLQCIGADGRVAYGGMAALELLAEFRPHLILLDIGMPRMDGYETARRIRERPEGKEPLLAALSGWGQKQDQRRTIEAGFDQHFVKPIEFDALQELVSTARRLF